MKVRSRRHGFAAGIAILSCFMAFTLLSAAVRASAPSGQYQVSVDAVLDVKTQLRWQRVATSPKTLADKSISASEYCGKLELSGFSDGWRVPTRKELETLVDASGVSDATIDENAFPGMADMLSRFCTSTPVLGSTPAASWLVDFTLGGSYPGYWPNDSCSVRCVHSVQ